MKIKAKAEIKDIATVYIAEFSTGKLIEFVESVQPPIPRDEKWVLMISSLFGCPVQCRFCDAGGYYQGKLTADEIFKQIDYLIQKRYPEKKIPVKKFKIQFARMGEPALNESVLTVLQEFSTRYDAKGFLPSISTIAPAGRKEFFDTLLDIKKTVYPKNFQLQFSIHSTDEKTRDWLIPVKKWNFQQISEYGSMFYDKNGRKITLNFALVKDATIDAEVLHSFFPPEQFLIKLTPVNPTYAAYKHKLTSAINPKISEYPFIHELHEYGYDVILSIGEIRENEIGSNCGQFITNFLKNKKHFSDSYTVPLQSPT